MKFRSSSCRLLASSALVPLTLVACSAGNNSATGGASSKPAGTSAASGDAIVLGSSLSLTGPLGQFGVNLKAGYDQKISEINAAGGVSVGGAKRQISLTVLDNRSDPNTASQQVRELILKDHAQALLGACTPPIVVPEALAAEREKVPYVSSCNPIHAFEAGNKTGWTYAWDLFFNEQDQATDTAKGLAMASSNKKVVLFTDTEPDGVAERPLYRAADEAAGLQVVGDYTFPVGTTDFSSFINEAKSKGAELVEAQMIPPDGIALWKQMKALGFKPKQGFVAKASAGASWTSALGPIAEGTLGDEFWTPELGKANSKDLVGTLGTKYVNNLSDFNIAVLGYSVAGIVIDAIAKAGSTDPAQVNAAIGKTDADYPVGHIAFTDKHTSSTPYLLTQWQGGNVVVVLPATAGNTLQSPAKGLQ